MDNLLEFIHLAEKLKIEKRNGCTSEDQHESVADHCWRVSLMVLILGPMLEHKINIEKSLKLAIIHDLAEIITGDSSYFIFLESKEKREEKYNSERQAILFLTKKLPITLRNELIDLWDEFENNESNESKFILALDRMEAQIQHNEAKSSKWSSHDIQHAPTLLDKYCLFDAFLREFKHLIQEESNAKIEEIKN